MVEQECSQCKKECVNRGWHLSNGLRFCSDDCICNFVEQTAEKIKIIETKMSEIEERLKDKEEKKCQNKKKGTRTSCN